MPEPAIVNRAPSVKEVAECICVALAGARENWRNALRRAMEAGDLLVGVQPRVRALGFNWKQWLADTCAVRPRTAQLYMQLAQNRAQIEAALEQHPDLSFRGAIRVISKPSTPKSDTSEAPETPNSDAPEVAAESKLSDVAAVVEFWRRADQRTRAAVLTAIGLDGDDGVLAALSQRQRQEIEHRISAHLPKRGAKRPTLTKIGKDARGRDVYSHGFRH
jgi:hypothetical protein